jgi:hypothetical protein
VTEAAIALATLGVEDPEGCAASRGTCPVARDDDLGSLPHDVAAEPDPRSASELEADAGRLANGARDVRGQPRRLEDGEGDPGPPGERAEAPDPIGDARRSFDP